LADHDSQVFVHRLIYKALVRRIVVLPCALESRPISRTQPRTLATVGWKDVASRGCGSETGIHPNAGQRFGSTPTATPAPAS
jgi:hypothetical protein